MSARKHAPLAPDGSCLPCLRFHHIFERVMVQITICDSPPVRGHRTPSPYAMTQPARLAGTAQPERSSSAGVAANLLCVLREVRQSSRPPEKCPPPDSGVCLLAAWLAPPRHSPHRRPCHTAPHTGEADPVCPMCPRTALPPSPPSQAPL